MGYAREPNCSPFALTKLRYRTEESFPRSLEPFEPTTHSSSHSNGSTAQDVPWPSQEAFFRLAFFLLVFNAQPIGTRRKGRPNFRWIDGL
ncbi:hypothetical protein TNCV_2067651 [Trichonephila clavipes]|uniref:Uncharacterized protein n=1 Tax=Trichonephila clavipes TaxID=2585209 RepID=A0A8X6W2X1_TRICX|nr:hypothetical protein TNCV_2067651 [Trichonephila clavipes]